MPKQYIRQNWINDSEPDLEADNLNHIENGIDNLDSRVAHIEDEGTASAIKDLKDVSLEELTDGQILEYDETSEKWKNTTIETDGLVVASEGEHLEISNIVESPFKFAIQNNIYGYIGKDEQGADTFCPFNSGKALLTDVKEFTVPSDTNEYTVNFDFDVKGFLLWFGSTGTKTPLSSGSKYQNAGVVENGVLTISGNYSSTDPTKDKAIYMENSKSITIKTTTNRYHIIMAFSDNECIMPLVYGLPQSQSEE